MSSREGVITSDDRFGLLSFNFLIDVFLQKQMSADTDQNIIL